MKNQPIPMTSIHYSSAQSKSSLKHQPSARQSGALWHNGTLPRRGSSLSKNMPPFESAENAGKRNVTTRDEGDNGSLVNQALVNDGFIFDAFLSDASETESPPAQNISSENFALFTMQNEATSTPEIASSLADALNPELLAEITADLSVDILLPKFGRVRVRSRKQASGRHLSLAAESESTHSLLQKYAKECRERLSNDLQENVFLAIQKSEYTPS